MSDDIVTRLRNAFTTKDYPMLKDHCESCAIPKEWGGHHDNCLYDHAANEIQRLRKLVTTWIICAERLVESNEGKDYEKALAFYLDCQRIANETC